jgi:protein gp37
MAENSKIEWTTHTFNPWIGCTKVSPACKNCYAERDFDHHYRKVKWGPHGTRVITSDANWRKPLAWNRKAAEDGIRPRVFCASLADVFEDWQGPIKHSNGRTMLVSYGDGGKHAVYEGQSTYPGGLDWVDMRMSDVRHRLFDLIDATPNLDWLLLTKRPENILSMWDDMPRGFPHKSRSNVWLGTSVENQEWADKRIPELLKCRELSPVLFLSCEPLVGPVDLGFLDPCDHPRMSHRDVGCWMDIDWVITGGESGPGSRPCDPGWFRSLRDQCAAASVPFHFKQWGEWGPEDTATPAQVNNATFHIYPGGERVFRVGKKNAGRLLDGRTHDDFHIGAKP